MRTAILFISDVHYTGRRPESEGVVLNAFLTDVKNQLAQIAADDVFALINGDLVQAADDSGSYDGFAKALLSPLGRLGIRKEKVYIVPGNHDIQRTWIQENKQVYAPVLLQKFDEGKFNDFVQDNSSLLLEKFNNYSTFIRDTFGPFDSKNLIGYSAELNDKWSLYCLNSSLTSFAGIEDAEYSSLSSDNNRLHIVTRGLYEWVQRNSKKKILMLHHPVTYLAEWASSELGKIIRGHFDLVLTGHTHEQKILCNSNGTDSFVWCQAPQLFTEKNEKLGYCFIILEDEVIDSIVYREWFNNRNAFRQGLDFAIEDDGVVRLQGALGRSEPNRILQMIEGEFNKTMSVFGGISPIWMERYFSLKRFDRQGRINPDELFTEEDLLTESEHNIKIITPAQYGLTSFAWHYILRLWKEYNKFGLYLDCNSIKRGKAEKYVKAQMSLFSVTESAVSKVVIDNWAQSDNDARQILEYLTEEFPHKPIIILCPLLEKRLAENEIVANTEFKFVNMYMAPLQRYQMRELVGAYNRRGLIAEEEIVLDRLDSDIQNFNMHRSPLNCISLLEVFRRFFEENPVNRTAMLEKLLFIIFDNEQIPTYRSSLDVKDCEFALGYVCEKMIRDEKFYFGQKEIVDDIASFCRKQKLTIDVAYLFDILLRNQIICQYEADLFGFRFAFWVYYFAAMRMTKSKDFTCYILENENYVHYPEILEFYTGSDRNREDAVKVVTEDIKRLSHTVHDKIGIPEEMNPFKFLKYQPSDAQMERTIALLEDNLQKTKLPNNIKDALEDTKYNPSLPYHQEVHKVLEEYSVRYLQELISIASKSLRNSDYIDPELKDKLFDAVSDAWYNTVRVIYLMAPALARDGEAGYDGLNLSLAESFDQYKDDLHQLLIQIIVNIPLNIIEWYKGDFFSEKLSGLIYEKVDKQTNPIIRHIMIGILIKERPKGWSEVVRNYLSKMDGQSYYFGNAVEFLEASYRRASMSEQDIARTKTLLLTAYRKMDTKGRYFQGSNYTGREMRRLPQRLDIDEEEE